MATCMVMFARLRRTGTSMPAQAKCLAVRVAELAGRQQSRLKQERFHRGSPQCRNGMPQPHSQRGYRWAKRICFDRAVACLCLSYEAGASCRTPRQQHRLAVYLRAISVAAACCGRRVEGIASDTQRNRLANRVGHFERKRSYGEHRLRLHRQATRRLYEEQHTACEALHQAG